MQIPNKLKLNYSIRFLFCLLFLAMIACDTDEDKKGRFLLKGNEKLESDDPKGAMTYYAEAIEIDSAFSEAYYNKALAHLQLKQLDESIADLSLAIRYNVNFYDAVFQRGLNYLDNGEFYKAKEDSESLMKIDSSNWKSFFLVGLVEERFKNYPGALTAFQEASHLAPDNSDLLVNQATVYYYQKDFEKAMAILEDAEKINPEEANLYNLRSMILFDQQNYQAALQAVEKAIQWNNRQAYYYNNKGLYLLFLDQPEEGLELINQSIQMDSKNPFALRNKGIYYVIKGDKTSALQYLDDLAKDYPDMELVQEYVQKAKSL